MKKKKLNLYFFKYLNFINFINNSYYYYFVPKQKKQAFLTKKAIEIYYL